MTLVGVLLGEGGSWAARSEGLSGNERGRACLATAVFLLSLHGGGEGGIADSDYLVEKKSLDAKIHRTIKTIKQVFLQHKVQSAVYIRNSLQL